MTLSLKPLFRETTKADYLHAIKDATNWLDSQIIETEQRLGQIPSSYKKSC